MDFKNINHQIKLKQMPGKVIFQSEALAELKLSLPFSDALPPTHVLERVRLRLAENIEPVWALPFLILHNNQITGCCGFKNRPQNGTVEIGYNVAEQARGLGIASAAIYELIKLIKTREEVSVIKALIAADNLGSIRVVQKNGFLFHRHETDDEGEELECWQRLIRN